MEPLTNVSQRFRFLMGFVFPLQKTELVHGVKVPYLIVGDPAYPLSPWLIKNYPFTAGITKEQDSFNAYLNRGRVVVEMAFGHLKGRWRRLSKTMEVEVNFAPTILSACCVLHNLVESREEDFPDRWLQIVTTNATNYPQPEPQQHVLQENCTGRQQIYTDGEVVRDALLEETKKQPLLTSIHWRLRRY